MTSFCTDLDADGIYDRQDIERLLGYMFHGGSWADELAADSDMPKAWSNPALGGTILAEMVDIKRTWRACLPFLSNPAALYMRFAEGLTEKEIARAQGARSAVVAEDLIGDVAILRYGANHGLRDPFDGVLAFVVNAA